MDAWNTIVFFWGCLVPFSDACNSLKVKPFVPEKPKFCCGARLANCCWVVSWDRWDLYLQIAKDDGGNGVDGGRLRREKWDERKTVMFFWEGICSSFMGFSNFFVAK